MMFGTSTASAETTDEERSRNKFSPDSATASLSLLMSHPQHPPYRNDYFGMTEHTFGATDDGDQELEECARAQSASLSEAMGNPSVDDISRENGYQYDNNSDHPNNSEKKSSYIQDDDGEEDQVVVLEQASSVAATNYQAIALHQSTAVITKSDEHLPYVFVLGNTFHPVHDYSTRKTFENSLFWFTYRCDFPEIVPYGITSDAGWGCMLRSAQMMLGHTLRIHFQSRHWRPARSITKHRADPFTSSLLTWFADYPGRTETFYSLHNMAAAGMKYEKLPGEWYGPTAAAYVLRDLVQLHSQTQTSLFRVHVSSEGTVYRNSVNSMMTCDSMKRAVERRAHEQKEVTTNTPLHPLDPSFSAETAITPESLEWDTSLLLLVPIRLGLDKFQESYVRSVAMNFWLPQSVGILGGRPRGARWFYGSYADGSKVLGLDPHTIQSAPKKSHGQVQLSDDYIKSVHTSYPEVFPIQKMDPSLVIGFYCRNKNDFLELEKGIELLRANGEFPGLFSVEDFAPDYQAVEGAGPEHLLGEFDVDSSAGYDDNEEDDFVLL